MSRSRLAFFVIILVAVTIVVVAALATGGGGGDDDGGGDAPDHITLRGFYGSEKKDFLANPEVVRILRERYGLTLDATDRGSIEQVTGNVAGMDFLWPSNDLARVLFEELNPQMSVKSQTIFRSPLVLYSWPNPTAALAQAGIVAERDNVKYADMTALAELIVFSRETWQAYGYDNPLRIKIVSTDPVYSNSGNMFYGLLANLLVARETGGAQEVADMVTVEQVLPTLREYYMGLGMLHDGSNALFEDFVATGNGRYPLIINYESLLIEFTLQHPDRRQEILSKIQVIYPEPTVWADHPLIALTPNGQRLLEALQDPEIQALAWEQHGFRSGLLGVDPDTNVLETVNLPERINFATTLPRPEVVQRVLGYLQTGQ